MRTAELYDIDFAEWARQNAELLRSGRVSEADLQNIAEEIGDMAKRERRSLRRRLERVIQHLLKWQFQPERRGTSWESTLIEQRQAIELIIKDSPSLRVGLDDVVAEAYPRAVRLTATETRRSVDDFPRECPYTLVQLLDEQFLP